MTQTIFNTFADGLVSAHVELLTNYLAGVGGSVAQARVVPGDTAERQALPMVAVEHMDIEEVIYQSGVYRVGVEFSVRVDIDTGSPESLAALSAAVLDYLQQTDLAAQLTAVRDPQGYGRVVIDGLVLQASRLSDDGDLQWRHVFVQDAFGYAPARG